MKARLLHWWRLLTEPSGAGRLFNVGMPKRWRVVYDAGGTSIPMAYDTACNYAELFGGKVERVQPPRFRALCQDCLRGPTFPTEEAQQAAHCEETMCECGGQLCACGSCLDSLAELEAGTHPLFKGQPWTAEGGLGMTIGSALDCTTLRLVRKGLTVIKDGRRGVVAKANGPACLVDWEGERYAKPELCAEVEVTDERKGMT